MPTGYALSTLPNSKERLRPDPNTGALQASASVRLMPIRTRRLRMCQRGSYSGNAGPPDCPECHQIDSEYQSIESS